MKRGFLYLIVIGFTAMMLISMSGCTASTPPPPTPDIAGTIAVQLASSMLTQTVAAYSPTPPPATPTLEPTIAPETPTAPVVESAATNRPEVQTEPRAACWKGGPPDLGYKLDSNISFPKKVELVGVGSIQGWYVIRNPYFNAQCWISATDLKIYSDNDLSAFPIITPGVPK